MRWQDIPETGPWPRFSDLKAATLPVWLAQSVDELVEKYGDRLKSVSVTLWAIYEYHDEACYTLRGEISTTWLDHADRPSEDELDQLPGMRRMERQADDVWDFIPLDAAEEGGVDGDVEYHLSRGGFHFAYDTSDFGGMCDYHGNATCPDGSWSYAEKIVTSEVEISATALAMENPTAILEQVDPTDFGLKKWPDPDGMAVTVDENDCLVVSRAGGGLFQHYERTNA